MITRIFARISRSELVGAFQYGRLGSLRVNVIGSVAATALAWVAWSPSARPSPACAVA